MAGDGNLGDVQAGDGGAGDGEAARSPGRSIGLKKTDGQGPRPRRTRRTKATGKAKVKAEHPLDTAAPAIDDAHDEAAGDDAEACWFEAPADPGALHAFILDVFGVRVSRTSAVPGHSAPFEYICHSFFEGTGAWPPRMPGVYSPDEPAQDCIVWANRGGGKTFLGALATALDLIFKDGIQIRILAGSLDQGHRMHEHLRMFFGLERLRGLVQGRITERKLRLKNGSMVVVLAQSQTSVRGTRVQKVRCDEVDVFDPLVWEAAQLTTRSKQCGPAYVRGTIECLSTMHRPHGLMYTLVREAREGKRRLLKWGLLDVMETCDGRYSCEGRSSELPGSPPARPCALLEECGGRAKLRGEPGGRGERESEKEGHIAVGDALRQKSRVPKAVWDSEMLCLRPSRSNSVFREFDLRRHVVREMPGKGEIIRWLGGMDFGYRAPTVVLWGALDHASRLWIADERIVREEVLLKHVEAIARAPWPKLEWIGIDPAGYQRNDQTGECNAQVMQRHGLPVRGRQSGLLAGLLAIRGRLEPADGTGPRLLIHERCAGLIEAMERYQYDESRPDHDQPLKNGPDHAVDALRYLVVNLDVARPGRVEGYL
jgi:ribosomal protein S14